MRWRDVRQIHGDGRERHHAGSQSKGPDALKLSVRATGHVEKETDCIQFLQLARNTIAMLTRFHCMTPCASRQKKNTFVEAESSASRTRSTAGLPSREV